MYLLKCLFALFGHVRCQLWYAAGPSLRRADSLTVVHGLSSCSVQAPEHVGSVVVGHRLSCSVECGILALNQGSGHSSPALHCRFLTTTPPGKSPCGRLSKYSTCELCIIIFIVCKYSIEWMCPYVYNLL